MRKISSFTLTELIIVLIVLAILAAIGIPIYQTTVAQNMINECTTQLEGIWEALKMYELDNDSFPDSLARAWDGYGDKALAIVWERKKKEGSYAYLAYMSLRRFKYFLANIFLLNSAYASFSEFCADTGFLRCPADLTPFDGRGNFSYGLLSRARNRSWEWISSNIGADVIIVGDCDLRTFVDDGDLASRHRRGLTREAEVIYRNGIVDHRTSGQIKQARANRTTGRGKITVPSPIIDVGSDSGGGGGGGKNTGIPGFPDLIIEEDSGDQPHK